ncbi:MAG: hypothetical protein K9L85_00840 [Candidatus Peribacteraceae bacterium]|nr:hypothetical protein [Candidatus Peribacteraceae bacterium]
MNKKFKFLFLIGLCLLTLIACKTDLDEGEDFLNPEKEQAASVFYSPKNEAKDIAGRTPVTFIWDSPVFSLQNPESAQKFLEKNIEIMPSIEGSWQLLGTTGILFEPSEDWKFSTHYEFDIPELGINYAFNTPRVEIEDIHSKNLGGQTPLTIFLNQPIDLSEANKISFDPDKDFDIAYGEVERWENEKMIKETNESIIEFIPKTEWDEQASFTLTLPKGAVGKEGDLPTLVDQKQGFSTIEKFQIINIDEPSDVFSSLRLEFSYQVNAHDFLKKITLEPIDAELWEAYIDDKLEKIAEDDTRSDFYFDPPGGRWQAGQGYEFNVSAEIEDQFGRQLGADKLITFKSFFSNRLESFFFPYSHKVFKNGELPKFFVKHSGDIDPVTLTITRLYPKYKSATASLDWEFSNLRQRIEELDLERIFPGFFTGTDYAGFFKLKLSYDDKNNYAPDTYLINFSVVDFLVEQKSAADETVQILVQSFPGEKVKIVPDGIQVITSSWEGRDGQLFNFGPLQKYVSEFTTVDNFWGVAVTAEKKIGIGSRSFQDGFLYGDLPVNVNQYEYETDVRGVVFTDRPLFQPGDRIYFKSIFRETNFFKKDFPLKTIDPKETFSCNLEIFDSRHESVFQTNMQIVGGSLDGYWDIPEDLVFGEYNIEITFPQYGENYRNRAESIFYVGEYRKPDFLVDGSWNCGQAIWQDECEATISSEYAFGGALAGKSFDYTVSLFGYKPIQWWWGSPDKQDRVILNGSGVLNKDGEFIIPVDLDFELDEENIDWDLLNLDLTVEAAQGDSSSTTVSIPFFVSTEQVELRRLPYFFGQNESEIEFSGTLEDLSGNALKKSLEAELIRKKWVRNDRKDAVGDYSSEWHAVEEVIRKIDISSDERGQFSSSFLRPEDSGEYILRVTSYDPKKRSAVAEENFYIWTSRRDEFTMQQNPENKTFVPFVEKDEYQIGEMATVLFPHTEWEIDRAHVTLERGKVLETLTPDIADQTVSFPVESWMAPNVIVSIVLEGRDEKGSPKVKFGAINIPIYDPNHELDISVQPEKNDYQPQDTVKLFLKTAKDGQPVSAELTVAVVDQTLLALRSRDQIGTLFQKFLKELPLGVYTSHTLANFISRADLEDIYEKVEEIKAVMDSAFGGGGKGDDVKPRGEFRDTAEWIATIRTDQNGEAVAEFKLPDNLTTWHIWVIGSTNDNAFGETEGEFSTSLPLLIAPIMPNIFRFGDESEVGLLIRRNIGSPKSEKVQVKLTLSEDFVKQEYEKTVSVEDEIRIFFPVEIARSDKFTWPLEGKDTTLKFEIEAAESGLRDAVEIQRRIMPPTISTTAAEFFRIEDPESLAVKSDERALESVLTFKVFGTLLDRLQKFVNEAREMNYGCTEQ